MRYLSESFAVGALHRSASIEQFLGPAFHHERQGIRWVTIEPRRNSRYAVVLHLSWDVGGEHFRDLLEFPPLDPEADDAGEVFAEIDDAAEALDTAERVTNAVRERWTNYGVAADDYLDYVRSGRLPDPLTKDAATDVVHTLLAADRGDERTVSWWLEGLQRRTGCLHISEMIFLARRPPLDGRGDHRSRLVLYAVRPVAFGSLGPAWSPCRAAAELARIKGTGPMTASPDTVTMPGQVWGLAAADPAGPLYVTSYAGRSPSTHNLNTTVLTAIDLTGATIWQRTFPGHPLPPRVDADGTVWVAHHDGGTTPRFTLTGVGAGGTVLHSMTPQQEPPEHLGAVVRVPDGVCAVWLPTSPRRRTDNGVARLARHGDTGNTIWSTPLPLEAVSFSGVVEAGDATGWQVRPKRAWKPSTLEVHYRQPLLVAGDRILVGINDGGSGIGVCVIIDTATGQITSTTEPAPYQQKAIAGPGCFLVGAQGYGTFSSTLYDRDGQPAQTWPSHGMMLIDQHGVIRGPESENVLPSRSRFRVLNADGSMRDGPRLSGYYTTYPALDADGTAVFWRDGTLLAIDASLHQRELFTMTDDRAVMSRVLLLGGTVSFALQNELLIFRNTGLASLAAGPWPCADGNIHGNPVLSD